MKEGKVITDNGKKKGGFLLSTVLRLLTYRPDANPQPYNRNHVVGARYPIPELPYWGTLSIPLFPRSLQADLLTPPTPHGTKAPTDQGQGLICYRYRYRPQRLIALRLVDQGQR